MAEADTGPPRKKVKKFQDDWLKEYSWLEFKDGKMCCTLCKKNKKKITHSPKVVLALNIQAWLGIAGV